MNKKKKIDERFKNFIKKRVKYILSRCDLSSYTYKFIFSDSEYGDSGKTNGLIEAEIDILPEYQSFTLTIYQALEEKYKCGNRSDVDDVLCHEMGHLHTEKLCNLSGEPYKTEQEVKKVNEELVTKIGNYLYYIINHQ